MCHTRRSFDAGRLGCCAIVGRSSGRGALCHARRNCWRKLLSGNSDANIGFNELCNLLLRLGFTMRVRGSHHVFNRRGLTSPINLQDIAGNAKEYQVRQVRRILLERGLTSIRGDRDGD